MVYLTAFLAAWAAPPACDFDVHGRSLWLLTIAPGNAVHNTFGHTAILDYDPRRGAGSRIYDWGHFDLKDPRLVWDVLTAQQDYWAEGWGLDRATRLFEHEDRPGVAQRLNLDRDQAISLLQELQRASRGREHTFRYHWYENNCTTKVADLLDSVLEGGFRAQHQGPSGTSPRNEVLRHTATHPLWLGLHWGSGHDADVEISEWDALFLPQALMEGARRTRVTSPRGEGPLVVEECAVTQGSLPWPEPRGPNRDGWLWLVGLGLAAFLAGATRVSKRWGRVAIGAVGSVFGLWGSAALLVGLLGTFYPYWGHHNLAFASPLSFLLVVSAVGASRSESSPVPARLALVVLSTALLGLLLAAIRLFGDHNLGFIGLTLPALLVSAAALRPRSTEPPG